jgi:hypothetical protein
LAAQAPGYQVAGIRKQYPNAYMSWTAETDAARRDPPPWRPPVLSHDRQQEDRQQEEGQ